MLCFSSPAILLRRIDYGDYDLVISFLSLARGRISVIAKNAKKSRKRFSGLLEPFAKLDIVCRASRRNGMPVLQEAAMNQAFAGIRGAVLETAYASYWTELIHGWIEPYRPQPEIFRLLDFCLNLLGSGHACPHLASIIFQIRFMGLAGFAPHLDACVGCGQPLDRMPGGSVAFDLAKGGIVCNGCSAEQGPFRMTISRGCAKRLSWVRRYDANAAMRLRFDARSMTEAQRIMEAFVPYHLGRVPKSLKFLKDVR